MQNRINEIEVAVATGTMDASQCFTEMRQLLPPNNPYLSEYPIKLVCDALITIVTHSGSPEAMAEALKPWRTKAEALTMPGKQQAAPDNGQSACEAVADDVEREWNETWRDIVAPNGTINISQLKKELADYSMLLDAVPKVYMHVTGGKISKPNTLPDVVCSVADDHTTELLQEQHGDTVQPTGKAAAVEFFAYDSECGFETFNTEAEAKKYAQDSIDSYREEAAEGWSEEEVESVRWGVVLGTTKQVPVPDDGYDGSQGVADSGPFVDYVLTEYTAPPAQVPVNQRLLDVAQAILAEDMIPLLPPEYVKRVQLVIADAKNQPACVSNDYVAGIEAVATMIDKKADDYAAEYGHDDMGSLSFGGGPRGEFRHDHHGGLIELAEEIRALAAAPQPTQQPTQLPDGWISVAERLPEEQDIYLGMLREDNPLGWTWKRPTEVAFGYLPHDRQRFSVFDPWAHENVDIQDSMTHWMPLPAPPTPTGGE